MLTRMYTELLQDALQEYTYAADLGGLKYAVKSNAFGLS